MSKMKAITIRSAEGKTNRSGKKYQITVRPLERKIEYKADAASQNAPDKHVVEKQLFGGLYDQILRWANSVGPDDVTYFKRCASEDEFNAWRSELLCDDHEVKWSVIVEYSDGSLDAYVCTGSQPFPQVFSALAAVLLQCS